MNELCGGCPAGQWAGGDFGDPASDKGNSEITHTHTRSQGQTLILRDAKSIFKEGEHFLDYSGVFLPAPGQSRLFVAE